MADKQNSSDAANQVFRQFAWHLAGTLARPAGKSGGGTSRAQPAKTGARSGGRR